MISIIEASCRDGPTCAKKKFKSSCRLFLVGDSEKVMMVTRGATGVSATVLPREVSSPPPPLVRPFVAAVEAKHE